VVLSKSVAAVWLVTAPPEHENRRAACERGIDAPYRLLNIGNGGLVKLPGYLRALEQAFGRRATLGHRPTFPRDESVRQFADRHSGYHGMHRP
jgi:hypothetical protein